MNFDDKSSVIYVEQVGPVGKVVLNRPEKRNAMSEAMWSALPAAVSQLDANPDVKVIVLTSSEDTAFSAGADIAELEEIAENTDRRASNQIAIREAQQSLRAANKPTIAQIWGACFGGGCGLAIHCDFRFAASTAKLAITPAKLGIVYPFSDTKQLVDLVGPANAKMILFTGRAFNTDEAMRLGLIDGVYAASALENYVMEFAEMLAENSAYSIQHMKRFIHKALDGQMREDQETEDIFRKAQEGMDAAEGIEAFLDKRPPSFRWNGD